MGDDFLQSDTSVKYDYIIANPPFAKNQDITHVMRMYDHLNSGGRLVAIMSPHWTHASDNKSKEFRSFMQKVGGKVNEIEAGAFAESGTHINTFYVIVNKRSDEVKEVMSNALF